MPTGWVVRDSVVERNKPGQGGPRYPWSPRVANRTGTGALRQAAFEWLDRAIQPNRTARVSWHKCPRPIWLTEGKPSPARIVANNSPKKLLDINEATFGADRG